MMRSEGTAPAAAQRAKIIGSRRLTHTGILGWLNFRKHWALYVMILPCTTYFFVFHYLPMVGLLLAFKQFNYAQGIIKSPWVGLSNFRFLVISGDLWRITRNTIAYNATFLVITQFVQIAVAVFFSEFRSRWFKKIAQSVIFFPHFISFVVLSTLVYNLFNYEFGSLNTFLTRVGLARVDVYNARWAWPGIIVAVHTWKRLGYGMVIFLAVIMTFDEQLFEAAELDGANILQRIRYITVPMLIPTLVILTLLHVGRMLRGQFELFFQLVGRNSVLYPVTDVIDTYVFRALISGTNFGMSIAVGFYQSVFGLILVLAVNRLVRWYRSDYALF